MSILDFFSRSRRTAPVARERLQVLLAHERAISGGADLAAVLKQEILEVIARHIPIDRDRVMVKLDRGAQVSTLAIDVEMPDAALHDLGPTPSARPRRRRSEGARTARS